MYTNFTYKLCIGLQVIYTKLYTNCACELYNYYKL